MDINKIKREINDLRAQDNYPGAFNKCCELFEFDPTDRENLETAAFLFLRMQQGNKDFSPKTAFEFALRANGFQFYGEVDKCLSDLNRAIEIKPNYDYAYQCRAMVYRQKMDYRTAIINILKAIEIAPEKGDYYSNAAILHFEVGLRPEALGFHEIAVKKNPENPLLWYNFGVDLAESGFIDMALEKFNRAIEIWPKYEDAIINRQHILDHLKKA